MPLTPARLRRRTRRTIGASIAAIVLPLIALVAASPAMAGGSDSPTPYTVSADALTLPAGSTFQDNGHVNVRYTVAGSNQPETRSVGCGVSAASRSSSRSSCRWRSRSRWLRPVFRSPGGNASR